MRRLTFIPLLIWLVFAANLASESAGISGEPNHSPANLPGAAGAHYSPLRQINLENVKSLQVAWSFDTHEPGGLETSPLVVDGVLYGITPSQRVLAVDAATGRELWTFGSGINGGQPNR